MPDLPPSMCLLAVLNSCPIVSHFDPKIQYSEVMLSGLGVKDPLSRSAFAKNVKRHLKPWKIDDENIKSEQGTSVQASADAIQTGAYAE